MHPSTPKWLWTTPVSPRLSETMRVTTTTTEALLNEKWPSQPDLASWVSAGSGIGLHALTRRVETIVVLNRLFPGWHARVCIDLRSCEKSRFLAQHLRDSSKDEF